MKGIVIVKDAKGGRHVFFPEVNDTVVALCIAGVQRIAEKGKPGREIGGGAVVLPAETVQIMTEIFRRVAVVSCGEKAWDRLERYSYGIRVPGLEFFYKVIGLGKVRAKIINFLGGFQCTR